MRRIPPAAIAYFVVAACFAAPGTAQDDAGLSGPREMLTGRPYSPYADRAFPTDVYFGDTHVHTGLSAERRALDVEYARARQTWERLY